MWAPLAETSTNVPGHSFFAVASSVLCSTIEARTRQSSLTG